VHALGAFIGITGYYRHFIRNYGAITVPLTSLLRKDAFRWSLEAESAFRALMDAPVLQLLMFDEVFIIECDASRT
jgi:hypothetical protein